MRRILSLCAGVAAMALAVGCGGKEPSGQAPAASGPHIAITVDSTGFNPPEVKATAGQPVTLVFTRVTEITCATSVHFAALNITRDLPLNTPVEISFTPAKKGDIDFACGMDMIKGVVAVE